MTSAVKLTVPPRGVTRMINPAVRLVLSSPLHELLDPAVVLLHVTGRKTGHRYDIPVGYAPIDGRLTVVTAAAWRVNLRGVAEVEVTLRGCRRRMHVMLEEEPAAVAVACQRVIDQLGWRQASRQLGISGSDGRQPTLLELKEAAAEYRWAVITLTT
jgi:hypothetical protein